MVPFYQREVTDVSDELNTDLSRGLSDRDAGERLFRDGQNRLREVRRFTLWEIVMRQISNPLSLILIVAGLLTLVLQRYSDFVVILIAVVINISAGTFQESKAERAFTALKKAQTKFSVVMRDGNRKRIKSEELVVGDILIIEAGSFVPADCRIISTKNISINESALTGEWVEVPKQTKPLLRDHAINEQTNMLFMGTLVSVGSAKAIVVFKGDKTELGKIAETLGENKEATPFQLSIKKISNFIIVVIISLLVVVIAVGIWRGQSFSEMILIAVALAVAAIPEGLPIAVTVVLAVGMERILKLNGLVRNLLAAETLGSTTMILTDKTGTLTMGEMALERIITLSSVDSGDTSEDEYEEVLKMAILSSDGYVEGDDKNGVVRGRPVERAILSAGIERDLFQKMLVAHFPQEDIHNFSSAHRFAASLNSELGKKGTTLFVSGAPELLMNASDRALSMGKVIRLNKNDKAHLMAVQNKYAEDGKRLLAIAYKKTEVKNFPNDKKGIDEFVLDKLVFAGFVVLHDPIRADAKSSIKQACDAHVRVVMVTGDQSPTAIAVARDVGIYKAGDRVVPGHEIEQMNDEELITAFDSTTVFYRVLPHQKLRLAEILKKMGEVVAMTGDGINDAPALHNANIGIALGSGTEVAKESSDLVLLDNSFTVIISAIKEGRRILDNLRKIVSYLLATGFTEIALVAVSILAGLPLPIVATQILWANIVGEGLMNFAFVFEPSEASSMRNDPRRIGASDILSRDIKKLITVVATVTSLLSVIMFIVLLNNNIEITEVRTMIFAAISVGSIFFAFSLKDFRRPIWTIDIRSNKYLLVTAIGSIGLLALAIYLPALANIVHVVPLSLAQALGILLFGIVNLLAIEVAKFAIFGKNSI